MEAPQGCVMIELRTEIPEYLVASRSLKGVFALGLGDALRAAEKLPDGGEASVVEVLDGRPGWGAAAKVALESGAAAVIIVDPLPERVDVIDDLRKAAANALVLLDREGLHFSLPDERAGTPHGIAAELVVASADESKWTVDAFGLLREASGEELELCTVRSTRGGMIVLAEGIETGVPATLLVTRLKGMDARPRLRLDLLAEERWEIVVDSAALLRRMHVVGSSGRREMPQGFEDRFRATLRRAIELLGTPEAGADDLTRFRADIKLWSAVERVTFST